MKPKNLRTCTRVKIPEVIKNANFPSIDTYLWCEAAKRRRGRDAVCCTWRLLSMRKPAEERKRRRVVCVAHVERTRWPSITSATRRKGRGRERESEKERGRTRWNVDENVARPTSSTSDTRMNTREERCRDGSHQSKGRKLANAQQTREPECTGCKPRRLYDPRDSPFLLEARPDWSTSTATCAKRVAGRSLIEPSANFRTRDGIECLTRYLRIFGPSLLILVNIDKHSGTL